MSKHGATAIETWYHKRNYLLTVVVVADVAKSTVAGSTKSAEGVIDVLKGKAKRNAGDTESQLGGVADSIKGNAKRVQGQAESKAEQVKQKL